MTSERTADADAVRFTLLQSLCGTGDLYTHDQFDLGMAALDRLVARNQQLQEALDALYEAHGCRDSHHDRNPTSHGFTCGECEAALDALASVRARTPG